MILWTKEQLNAINKLTKSISKSKGCRIVVSGPRGSGKTMLLIFIANLAKKIFQNHFDDNSNDIVVIRDGRLGRSQILFEKLEEKFNKSGIVVHKGEKDQDSSKRKLILVDEANITDRKFPEEFTSTQHVIFFTSQQDFVESNLDYLHIPLTYTLRSTVQLNNFIESFRCKDPLNHELQALTAHNFEGSEPIFKCVQLSNKEDPYHYDFVKQCTSVILQQRESAKGLHEILVSPYVHPITQNRILSSLQTMKVNYQYRNPLDKFTKFRSFNSMFESPVDHSELEQAAKDRSEPSENFPEVVIATGNHIDGVEYGSVILLLDRSLPVWF